MKAVRILTGFLALIFCIALWGLEMGAASLGVVRHFFSGEGIAKIIKKADVREVLSSRSESGDYKEAVREMVGEEFFGEEITDEMIDDFLSSQTFEDLTELVGDVVISVMLGDTNVSKLTPEALRKVFDDNAAEIVTLIDGEYSEAREAEIRDIIDSESQAVFEEIDVSEITESAAGQIDESALKAARFALKSSTLYIALIACAAVVLIIAALRLKRFGWLLWTGITTFLAGALTLLIGIFIGPVLRLAAELPDAVTSVSGIIGSRFILTGAIMLAAAVAGIVLACLLRALTKKPLPARAQYPTRA